MYEGKRGERKGEREVAMYSRQIGVGGIFAKN